MKTIGSRLMPRIPPNVVRRLNVIILKKNIGGPRISVLKHQRIPARYHNPLAFPSIGIKQVKSQIVV